MSSDRALQETYAVELDPKGEPNGVASILCTLLQQNFEKYPERAAIARRMRRPIAVHSTDTDSSATVVFGRDRAVVHSEILDRPTVIVNATVDQILQVAQLKVVGKGLVPIGFFTKRGLHVLGEIGRHRLVVKGLLTHTMASLRTIALVSIAE